MWVSLHCRLTLTSNLLCLSQPAVREQLSYSALAIALVLNVQILSMRAQGAPARCC
jgi:hypothetical protein